MARRWNPKALAAALAFAALGATACFPIPFAEFPLGDATPTPQPGPVQPQLRTPGPTASPARTPEPSPSP